MTMSAGDIERHITSLVFNARNLPMDARSAFLDAACIDLLSAGMAEGAVQTIKKCATERLAAEQADSSRQDHAPH